MSGGARADLRPAEPGLSATAVGQGAPPSSLSGAQDAGGKGNPSRISWINTAAIANDIAAGLVRQGKSCSQAYWFDLVDRFAEMFAEGPAYLEVDGAESRIRWANGLSFRDPPAMAVRLADGRFA